MAGALASAPLSMCTTTFPPGVSTRNSSSAVLSSSVKRHRLQTIPCRNWRKDSSGHIPDAAVVMSAASDFKAVSRRELMSLLGASLGAFLLLPSLSRGDGVTAGAEDLREGLGLNPHEGDFVVVIDSWQNWVKTWLV
ncbi:unnamed protein product [Calypogeia fissa]